MRALLVTSQVTYVPDNYAPLFKELVKTEASSIQGIVLLQNLNFEVVKKALGLFAVGATKTGTAFMANIAKVAFKKDPRESIAKAAKIPVFKLNSMNSEQAITLVKELKIDLVVNMRTRCIYKKAILEAPRLGCINIHHGLLPEYRGTMCDLYALFEGRPAGFSIHHMVEKIDAGVIYKRCEVAQGEKNYQEYLRFSAEKEAKALSEIFTHVRNENRLPEPLAFSAQSPHHYSKNPDREKINSMIKRGLIL